MAEPTQGLGPCRTCKQASATWIQSRDEGPPGHLRPDLKLRRLCIKSQPLGLLEKAGDLVTQAHPPAATSKWHLADLPHSPGPKVPHGHSRLAGVTHPLEGHSLGDIGFAVPESQQWEGPQKDPAPFRNTACLADAHRLPLKYLQEWGAHPIIRQLSLLEQFSHPKTNVLPCGPDQATPLAEAPRASLYAQNIACRTHHDAQGLAPSGPA